MIKKILSIGLVSICLTSSLVASEVLAVVNGKSITTEVAPNGFDKLDKDLQKRIVNRLIDKRLACDYALSTPIVKTKKFKQVLKHVLNIDDSKKNTKLLTDVFKDKGMIKGYTKEQLYSKTGLLAFDFLVNKKAEEIKPTIKEEKKYYNQTRYKYDTPAMKDLLIIVVDKKKTADMIEKKLGSAKDILQEFSTLAKKYSLAPSAKQNGYFGKIAVYEINDVLKPYLKDLKRTEFTKKPIKTEFGYQIFYVLNDIPAFNSKFNLVKTQVEDAMIKKDVKDWAMTTIQNLRKKATIKTKY